MIKFCPANIRTWSLLGQRGTFGKTVFELAGKNDKVIAMTADQANLIGLARFEKKYPERYFNMGISEQNAINVAAGLASEGYIPFLAFQAAFASMRCADQIHAAMAYMKSNVKLVGIFTGLTLGDCGPTHYGLHDIALCRSFPNITVLSPSDATQMVKMMIAMTEKLSPFYMRIGGPNNIPVVYEEDFDFEIGKAITLRDGTDIAIIATGAMVYNSLKAADLLAEQGLSVKVIDMHTIKPLDVDAVKATCSTKLIVTVEEHSIYGGLGGAVAESLSLQKVKPPHLIIGVSGDYPHAGSYTYLLDKTGLTAEKIALQIQNIYKEL